jgi:hypothetical protein
MGKFCYIQSIPERLPLLLFQLPQDVGRSTLRFVCQVWFTIIIIIIIPLISFCVSWYLIVASAHHQETWNVHWNVRTLVLSLRAFMTTKPGELGSVATLVSTQRICALQSTDYHCRECGLRHKWLVQQTPAEQTTITISTTRFLSRNSQLQLQNLLKSSSTTAAASRTFKSNNKTIKTARSLSIVQRLFQNMRPKSVIALCLCFSLMLFISWVRSQWSHCVCVSLSCYVYHGFAVSDRTVFVFLSHAIYIMGSQSVIALCLCFSLMLCISWVSSAFALHYSIHCDH